MKRAAVVVLVLAALLVVAVEARAAALGVGGDALRKIREIIMRSAGLAALIAGAMWLLPALALAMGPAVALGVAAFVAATVIGEAGQALQALGMLPRGVPGLTTGRACMLSGEMVSDGDRADVVWTGFECFEGDQA